MRLEDGRGRACSRLGLAGYPGQDPACVRTAHRGGVNFFFFYDLGRAEFVGELAALAGDHRDEMILAAGSDARDVAGLAGDLDAVLDALGVEAIDVFFVEYVCPSDDDSVVFGANGLLAALDRCREEGTVRHVGASAHDRGLSLRLVEDGRVDVLMHRYNLAHRGAEAEVFPAATGAGVPVIAFTATRWGTLLEGHPQWRAAPPSAADCYRYCVSSPAIELVLAAPSTVAELRADLEVLRHPRMDDGERSYWERYGELVYGDGSDDFETRWP